MTVRFHPDFAQDILRFAGRYKRVSPRLAARFRMEVEAALRQIKEQPTAAGHLLNTGSNIVRDVRRRNLVSFPHFVLYGLHGELLIYGALIPSASDPLTWLDRFA